MPQRNWNNIPDFLRAMPAKVSAKDGKISNKITMGKRLERFGEFRIVDEMPQVDMNFREARKRSFRYLFVHLLLLFT